jgi:hypothetical protein
MSDDCPICFEVINNTQNVVITGCKHKFHTTCLLRSIQTGGYRCPNCRGCLLATDTASGATGSASATGAAAGPTGSASATGAATGPTGASHQFTYNGVGARDISMNIIQGPNRSISEEMRRISEFQYYSTRVTYHNDSSDDESGVNGG